MKLEKQCSTRINEVVEMLFVGEDWQVKKEAPRKQSFPGVFAPSSNFTFSPLVTHVTTS